jgi:hypothetical protein
MYNPQVPKAPRYVDWERINNVSNVVIVILLAATLSFLSYQHFKATSYCEAIVNYGDRAKLDMALGNKTVIYNTKTNGMYSYDSDVYCVWNQSKESNDKTESHEYCHFLIDEGMCYNKQGEKITCREHFCED